MPYFAKLWYEIYMSESVDRRYMEILCASAPFIDYVATVLLEERTSLNNAHIHQFFCNFFNRVKYFMNFRGFLSLPNAYRSFNFTSRMANLRNLQQLELPINLATV